MKHLVATFMSAVLASGIFGAERDLDDPEIVEAFIDGVVLPSMAANNSPVGTVAIARGETVVLAKGYGFEDIDRRVPVDPEMTLFRPGSVSKLFTWVSVMQLVEQGKLDLDNDVNRYLEDFQIDETFDEPITLRAIMTHTPGFEDGGLGYLIVDDPDAIQPLPEAMERFQPRRVNPPGAQTAYSNYGTALAGLIVELVSGVPFNDYVKANVFDPLGMTRSSFAEPLPNHLADRMAGSYTVGMGAYAKRNFEIIANFAPAGSMSATSTDMIRFGQAILAGGELDGNRILRQETVDEMLTRNFAHDERVSAMLLGFYESHFNGHRVVGHGGDSVYFHSYFGIDLDEQLVFFSSFGADGGANTRSAIAPAIYDRFFPHAESPPVPPSDFSARAAKYAGTYGFWRQNFSTIEKAAGLANVFEVRPTADNTLLVGAGGIGKQYVEVDENLFRELDDSYSLGPGMSPRLIAFQEDDAGEITGFVFDALPFMSTRKLAFYETPNFNLTLLGVSLVILLLVLMRRIFQRREISTMATNDRVAVDACVYAALGHWLTLVVGALVISSVVSDLISGLPTIFKFWLVMPIASVLLTIYLLYRAVAVWRESLFDGAGARVRFTVITLAALYLSWFYYFWNILGFQFKA